MRVAAAERYNTTGSAGRFDGISRPRKSGSWQWDAPIPVLEGRPRNNNALDGRLTQKIEAFKTVAGQ